MKNVGLFLVGVYYWIAENLEFTYFFMIDIAVCAAVFYYLHVRSRFIYTLLFVIFIFLAAGIILSCLTQKKNARKRRARKWKGGKRYVQHM